MAKQVIIQERLRKAEEDANDEEDGKNVFILSRGMELYIVLMALRTEVADHAPIAVWR